ncbi:tectonic-like complex member Mks1 [Eurosta solidaginis]|uniref:tectonic-like complex member Mks1 n=1 Tax=Eurosta solidaginis TaxID=178769 RepID=UPI003531015E
MFQIVPKHTGVYNIRDSIEFLEIEVHFRHINSLLKLPKLQLNRTTNKSAAKNGESVEQPENVTNITRIRWQQKLFSPGEFELYKDSRNCITDVQKKYHQWLQANAAQSETSSSTTSMGTGSKRRRRKKQKKKSRKAKTATPPEPQYGEIFTYVQEDNFIPCTMEKTLELQSNTKEDVQLMYVYAAITPDTELLKLSWHPQLRQLRLYPDFNDFNVNPYFIEIDTDYRHLYAYAIHNASQRCFNASPTLYLELPELATHWQQERDLSTEFAMPPKRTTRVVLLFELRTAQGFSYDNIHVRYHIQLPANVLPEEGVLHASTHASTPSQSSDSKCYFGYTFQLTLLCEENFNTAHLLHIYFELISNDSWERERAEGYTHYSTYLFTGAHTVELQCLRPTAGFLDTISRYLIGGRRKFDFMRFYTDNSVDTTIQCRYGCRMESTGVLELTCQRFTQRNCDLLSPCNNRMSGMTLDDIMLAYREARRRLEAVVLK